MFSIINNSFFKYLSIKKWLLVSAKVKKFYFGFLTPYLERPWARTFTPPLSNAPRIIW